MVVSAGEDVVVDGEDVAVDGEDVASDAVVSEDAALDAAAKRGKNNIFVSKISWKPLSLLFISIIYW